MRRLLIALAALLLVLGMSPVAAGASGGDEDNSGSGSVSSGSDDDDDDSDDDSDDDDSDDDDSDDDSDSDSDDDDSDEVDDDDSDDDGGHHQRRRRHRNRGGDDDSPSTGAGGTGTQPPPTGPAPNSATVQIADRSFDPSTIRVAVGGTVTWDNVSREHTVTADDSSFDSGVIDQGQSFSKKFSSPGSIDYRCLIHPEMTGQVVVGDGPATTSSSGASSSSSQRSAGSPSTPSVAAAGATSAGSSGQPALGAVRPPLTAAAATTADVDVRDFEFSPPDVTIAPGGTVRWTLSGTAPHTVTSDSFDSGMLKAGDTYEQTFNDVGTIEYRCEFHSEMLGTITVAESAAPPADAGGGGGAADPGGGDDAGAAAADDASPVADVSANDGATGLLAQTGFGGVPALLIALGVILLGWAAVVTGRRRGRRIRRPV